MSKNCVLVVVVGVMCSILAGARGQTTTLLSDTLTSSGSLSLAGRTPDTTSTGGYTYTLTTGGTYVGATYGAAVTNGTGYTGAGGGTITTTASGYDTDATIGFTPSSSSGVLTLTETLSGPSTTASWAYIGFATSTTAADPYTGQMGGLALINPTVGSGGSGLKTIQLFGSATTGSAQGGQSAVYNSNTTDESYLSPTAANTISLTLVSGTQLLTLYINGHLIGSVTDAVAFSSIDGISFGVRAANTAEFDNVTVTQAVPEPASVAVLALACIPLLRRRSRRSLPISVASPALRK